MLATSLKTPKDDRQIPNQTDATKNWEISRRITVDLIRPQKSKTIMPQILWRGSQIIASFSRTRRHWDAEQKTRTSTFVFNAYCVSIVDPLCVPRSITYINPTHATVNTSTTV